jgi:hypothetical protein
MAHFVKFEVFVTDTTHSDIVVNVDHIVWGVRFKEEGYSKLQMVGDVVLKVKGDLSELDDYGSKSLISG